jgi:hypothetical protein
VVDGIAGMMCFVCACNHSSAAKRTDMMWIMQVFASHQVTGDWQWVTNNMGRAVGI